MKTFNSMLIYFVLLGSLLFLQGCATMDESDCLSADWNDIGYRDGSRGLQTSMLESRANACNKYGITLDRNSYLAGHSEGLYEFCLPDNGYQMGSDKQQYNYVCPIDIEGPFLSQYVKGLNLAINLLDDEIRGLDNDIREAELDLREASTEEQKNTISKRISRLKRSRDSRDYEEQNLRNWLSKAIDNL